KNAGRSSLPAFFYFPLPQKDIHRDCSRGGRSLFRERISGMRTQPTSRGLLGHTLGQKLSESLGREYKRVNNTEPIGPRTDPRTPFSTVVSCATSHKRRTCAHCGQAGRDRVTSQKRALRPGAESATTGFPIQAPADSRERG